jgi:hypothetical protein
MTIVVGGYAYEEIGYEPAPGGGMILHLPDHSLAPCTACGWAIGHEGGCVDRLRDEDPEKRGVFHLWCDRQDGGWCQIEGRAIHFVAGLAMDATRGCAGCLERVAAMSAYWAEHGLEADRIGLVLDRDALRPRRLTGQLP